MNNYTKLAWKLALLSEDDNTKVGALVVVNGKVVGSGFNYPISLNVPGKKGYVHAEVAAIMGNDCKGGTMFCSWACCTDCAKVIYLSGIKKLVTCNYDYKKWEKEIGYGQQILKDNGVVVEIVKPFGPLLIGGKIC